MKNKKNFHSRFPRELCEDNSQHHKNVQQHPLNCQYTVCLPWPATWAPKKSWPQACIPAAHCHAEGHPLSCTTPHHSLVDHTVTWIPNLSLFGIVILGFGQFSGLDLYRWSHKLLCFCTSGNWPQMGKVKNTAEKKVYKPPPQWPLFQEVGHYILAFQYNSDLIRTKTISVKAK